MRSSTNCSALLALLALVSGSAQASALSAATRIESVMVRDDLGVVRLKVLRSNPVSNPANCDDDDYVDIRLDDTGRSASEQRELMNLINLAFVTRRAVQFHLLDSNDKNPCSTKGTSSTIRVAVGIQVLY